jgi:hypothetical protein
MVIYCDDILLVYLTENPVNHGRTKHVELDIHFVREMVALGQLATRYQFADIMTKGLLTPLFNEFQGRSATYS